MSQPIFQEFCFLGNSFSYYFSGHMYFIEDGNEENNIFDHNLGIRAEIHDKLLVSDLEPAIFWITNALYVFRKGFFSGENHAVKCSNFLATISMTMLQLMASLDFGMLWVVFLQVQIFFNLQ
jgi:hypothetical protein